jgi:hypothetical protein
VLLVRLRLQDEVDMSKSKSKPKRLLPEERVALDVAEREIERARKTYSTQDRFKAGGDAASGASAIAWVKLTEIAIPDYTVNSGVRDMALREIAMREPRLAGVLNSVVLVDANRGWNLVGGRNQVRRFLDLLHTANDGDGWRSYARMAAKSFWGTDMGSVTEIGRDGRYGPMRALYHVDSARCFLTGKHDTPLQYKPPRSTIQDWRPEDFFRITSMPSDDEGLRGLGFCAVSRAVEITRILYAVMAHDQELLGARMPRGLLLLQNISEEQWNQSLESREMQLDSMERAVYGGVQVIAQTGSGMEMDAKLVALSQLPANFDMEKFINLSMYTYALCFGFDPSEFWPVASGAFSRGTETQVQHAKAAGKGGVDFALGWQERFQQELPDTVSFEFEQRDDAGELMNAQVAQAKVDVVTRMYESGLTLGQPLITREQALRLLVDSGVIPSEWTVDEEATQADDADSSTDEETEPDTDEPEQPEEPEGAVDGEERWLDKERVQRAMSQYPNEDIVRHSYPSGKTKVIWRHRSAPKYHVIARATGGRVLYEKGKVKITQEDVDKAIADARRRVGDDFAALLTAPTATPEQLAKLVTGE